MKANSTMKKMKTMPAMKAMKAMKSMKAMKASNAIEYKADAFSLQFTVYFFANAMNAVQAMEPPAAMKKKQNQDAMKATRSQDSILCYIAFGLWC